MRMQLDKREVTTIGGGDTIKLRIASNAKAFKALIDKLYSDKPRAVVRELWSNAYDAHTAIGKPDLPFHTHVPTTFEPWFSVRDFGPGMDAKFVETLYRTVFESTKDQDNNAVGKWGLGSKSPWAYTDSFTVTCYDGTTMRSYSAYIDEDQFPNFKLMMEGPSEEPRGVEVRVPVHASDVYTFQAAIERVAIGFDTKPNIGDSSITLVNVADVASASGKDWYYISDKSDLSNDIKEFDGTTSYAWQGCVLYPIDASLVPNMSPVEEAILSGGFIIRFPIGAVDINPAREGLSYDSATVRALKDITARISVEVVAEQQAAVDAAPSYFAACVVAARARKQFEGSPIFRILRDKLTYRGRDVAMNIDLSTVSNRYRQKLYEHGGANIMFVGRQQVWGRNYFPRRRGHSFSFYPAYNVKYSADMNVSIVWEDPNATIKTADKRFDTALREGKFENAIWIRCKKDCIALKRLLVLTNTRPEDVIELASMPYTRSQATGYVRTKIQAKELRGVTWDNTTVDTSIPTIYVPLSRGHIVTSASFGGYTHYTGVYSQAFEAVKTITGIAQERLIGIPKTLEHLSKRGTGWVDFRQYVNDVVKTMPHSVKVLRAAKHVYNNTDQTLRYFLDKMCDDKSTHFKKGTVAREVMDTYSSVYASVVNNRSINKLWQDLLVLCSEEGDYADQTTIDNLSATIKRFDDTYPMVKFVDTSPSALLASVNYIKMIDAFLIDTAQPTCDVIAMPDTVSEAA